MSKIVYHGTFSEHPPHMYGETFHAGTMRSTDDRSADQIGAGEVEEPAIRQVHGYEISDKAPVSKVLYDDPMFPETPGMGVPEDRTDKIYPYWNAREDVGSTSYVIPSGFVGKHVKHLGVQFQGLHASSDEDYDTVMNAVSTMAGGKRQ